MFSVLDISYVIIRGRTGHDTRPVGFYGWRCDEDRLDWSVQSYFLGRDPLTMSMNTSHTYPQSNGPLYRERRMCHASLLATNTGMSAATKYQLHRSRSEGCCSTRIQQRFIAVVKFLVSRCRDRTRLRIQSTNFSQPVCASWTWAKRSHQKRQCVLLDPTRQNRSGQTWPVDKTKNWANNKWDQATELNGRQPLPVAHDYSQLSHKIQSAGRGLPA